MADFSDHSREPPPGLIHDTLALGTICLLILTGLFLPGLG